MFFAVLSRRKSLVYKELRPAGGPGHPKPFDTIGLCQIKNPVKRLAFAVPNLNGV